MVLDEGPQFQVNPDGPPVGRAVRLETIGLIFSGTLMKAGETGTQVFESLQGPRMEI